MDAKYKEISELMQIIDEIIQQNYLQHNDKIYECEDKVEMGAPLSHASSS